MISFAVKEACCVLTQYRYHPNPNSESECQFIAGIYGFGSTLHFQHREFWLEVVFQRKSWKIHHASVEVVKNSRI